MKNRQKKRLSVPVIVLMVILGIYTVSIFVPLFWGFVSSFKTRKNFLESPFGFPTSFEIKNYLVALQNFSYVLPSSGDEVLLGGLLLNTLLYSLGGAFFATMSACVVAYATSKFDFFTDRIIYGIVIVTMALPIIGSAPSELHVARTLGIFDTHVGMWIMKSSFLGMYYLIFYAIFKGIPKDFNDAAAVDGASHYRTFFTIIMPLVSKTFSTIYLLYFMGFWNDYQTPLIYMPSYPTLAMGLFSFTFANNVEIDTVPKRMAGNFIVFIPILIVFLVFRNKLLGNVSMGGIKE